MTRMYWGPRGRMMRKSRFVVNWMAANSNSNVRSFFGFTAQNPAFALQPQRLVFSRLGRECFSSGPWKVARNRRRAKRDPDCINLLGIAGVDHVNIEHNLGGFPLLREWESALPRLLCDCSGRLRLLASVAMTVALETSNLTRDFGSFRAVNQLSLRVAAGCFYGFLGPNGAGKSTTIKMLTGLLAPSGGSVRVLGEDISDPARALAVKRRVGVVPENLALFDNLTAREYLTFVGRMHLLPRKQ